MKRYLLSSRTLGVSLLSVALLMMQACGEASPTSTPTPLSGLPLVEGAKIGEVVDVLVTTDSGLQYQDLKGGTGALAIVGSAVTVHYTGWLEDGTKFDSSVDRAQPFAFVLGRGQVIKGWDEGVLSMRVGGKRKLIIPSDLGYGDRGFGTVIPPRATLVFEVELLRIS